MVLPVSATVQYVVNSYGAANAALRSMIDKSNIPLDTDLLDQLHVTLTSDDATNAEGVVRRILVINLVQPPTFPTIWNAPEDQGGDKAPFQLSIQSTSDEDAAGGVGLHTATINYKDPSGSSTTESVTLTGKTPALCSSSDFNDIVSVAFDTTGSSGTSQGCLLLKSIPLSTYEQRTAMPPTDTIQKGHLVASVPEGYYVNYPPLGDLSDLSDPFLFWMTNALTKIVGPVVTKPVTLA